MLKVDHISVMNLENAIRGARNPLNSWARSDSCYNETGEYVLGENDLSLAGRLCRAGSDHRKFIRQILALQQAGKFKNIFQRFRLRKRLDIRAAENLHFFVFVQACREIYHIVIHGEGFGHLNGSNCRQCGRIGDVSGQAACSGSFRTDQVNSGIPCAAASFEVSVECTKRNTGGIGALSHADARAAGAFQNTCSGIEQIGQRTVFAEHAQNLTAARRNGKADFRTYGFAFQHCSNSH